MTSLVFRKRCGNGQISHPSEFFLNHGVHISSMILPSIVRTTLLDAIDHKYCSESSYISYVSDRSLLLYINASCSLVGVGSLVLTLVVRCKHRQLNGSIGSGI